MKSLEEYTEQLINNTIALEALEVRYNTLKRSRYYNVFGKVEEQMNDLKWTLKIRKRVLRMRYRILENLKRKIDIDMNDTSIMQRELNVEIWR